MKFHLTFLLTAFAVFSLLAQPSIKFSEQDLDKAEFESHLMYIASDELAGRRTTSEGAEKAAQYIAAQFEKYGVKPAPGHSSFFQKIPFNQMKPPVSGSLTLGKSEYRQGDDFLILKGSSCDMTADAVFAGHGWIDEKEGIDDYKGLDVKGKIVFVLPGNPLAEGPSEIFRAMSVKRKIAAEKGAAGLVELFRINFPWRYFKNYFGGERLDVVNEKEEDKGAEILYAWLKEGTPDPVAELEKGAAFKATIKTSGVIAEGLHASNVVGVIKGTDETLQEEYVLLSAHYDHVGVGKQGGAAFTPQDSIFNGARDNGMGTVALLAAAKSLAANPPRRSVVLLACTGEEMGMLGSAYYAEHPMVPLEKTVFNLNNDGAGYNSTEHISVIGWGRTNTNADIEKAAATFGMEVAQDPAPEQNLYERSDNISFARKGIPAIDISPGVTEMNEAIFKYYHQATDNPDTIDYDYLLKFCQTYSLAARLIANKVESPAWTPGDKFEKRR